MINDLTNAIIAVMNCDDTPIEEALSEALSEASLATEMSLGDYSAMLVEIAGTVQRDQAAI